MKKIYNLILTSAFLVTFMFACNESEDVVTDSAVEGGGVIDASKTSGKFLGAPKTGSDSMDVISNAELSFGVTFANGGNTGAIDQIAIVKSYSGANIVGFDEEEGEFITEAVSTDEVEVVTFSPEETPFTYSISDQADFYEGLGVGLEDMMVGDAFTYRTKMYMSDGRELYASPGDGEYTVSVACFSDLAGAYTSSITRDDGANVTYDQVITETNPGEYITSRSGTWAPTGVLATPTGEAPLIFRDVCSQLFVADQTLGQFYSNPVYGPDGPSEVTGSVDVLTGVITLTYAIEFSGAPTLYTEVMTPKN